MKKYVFLVTALSVLLISCSGRSKRAVEIKGNGIYAIDPNSATVLESNIYKSIKTIILETSEACLIGSINSMRVYDQHIYILDRTIAKSLYVFDMEGRFVRQIGGVGQGPGEYLQPFDFTIDKDNNTVYILDGRSQRINKYDLASGRFLHAINPDRNVRSDQIEYVEGKLYADAHFYNHSDDNYLLRVINESTGVEESRYLNVMEYYKGISNNATQIFSVKAFYVQENGNAVFVQPYMDHVIQITRDSIYSLIEIKSKDVLTPEEIKKVMEKGFASFMGLFRIDKYQQIQNFFEHDNRIFFSCYKNGLRTFLFNKQTNELNIIRKRSESLLFKENKQNLLFSITFRCQDANGVYYSTSSDAMLLLIEAAKAGDLSPDLDSLEDLKNLEEDANPVLFYYEFKD